MQRVEDLYKPFKKNAPPAPQAREGPRTPRTSSWRRPKARGALSEAAQFANAGGYPDAESALQGARDIVAEAIADDAEHTAALRAFTHKTAQFEAVAAMPPKKRPTRPHVSRAARRIPNRVLAIDRGEKEGKLRVRVRTDADTAMIRSADASYAVAAPSPTTWMPQSPTDTNA
ncbi:MAG: hypothetical protein ACLT98_14355 [Eggerthellaceae bacterium]